MKKIKFVPILFCLLCIHIADAKEKGELLQQIKTIEEKVFPRGNLFDQRLDNIDLWNNLTNNIQEYINLIGNKKLNNMFIQSERSAQNLISTMQWVRLRVLSLSMNSGKVYSNYLLAKNRINRLKENKEELDRNIKELKKMKLMGSQVILQFILLLERLIDRAVIDLQVVGKKLRPSALFSSG
jgi:hypothetical protein